MQHVRGVTLVAASGDERMCVVVMALAHCDVALSCAAVGDVEQRGVLSGAIIVLVVVMLMVAVAAVLGVVVVVRCWRQRSMASAVSVWMHWKMKFCVFTRHTALFGGFCVFEGCVNE